MEPVIPDLRAAPRGEAYDILCDMLDRALEGSRDEISAMATASALLHNAFGSLWTGFYRVVEPGKSLRVGPYQGTLGCLDISFGRGVCGTAASDRRTVIVKDVNDFAGHITCDARSRSEIVVPVFRPDGSLLAVLDIDSEIPAMFDETDQVGLEKMMSWFSRG